RPVGRLELHVVGVEPDVANSRLADVAVLDPGGLVPIPARAAEPEEAVRDLAVVAAVEEVALGGRGLGLGLGDDARRRRARERRRLDADASGAEGHGGLLPRPGQ